MKRIALIFNGDLDNRKGYINAVIERAKRLRARGEYSVDIFCFSQYDNWFIRKLRHTQKKERPAIVEVDSLPINMLWYPFSLIDYILSVKLHLGKVLEPIILKNWLSQFKHYDLICAHSIIPGLLASNIYKRYHIPYCITWHGSDIHTEPFVNKKSFKIVSDLINKASCNMFVSNALLQTAKQIKPNIEGVVLYNAASDAFSCFNKEERKLLRNRYKSTQFQKVVAFAGGLVPIKNADVLPDIFASIQNKYQEQIEFWIIGDGKLRSMIDQKLSQLPDVYCKLWGDQAVDAMPALLNCVDVLILPSNNEGLPLVVVEALKSGANVVTSDVGGIKEVIGIDNVVSLGVDFIQRFSQKVVDCLNSKTDIPQIPEEFDWDRTSNAECEIYNKILNKS